MLLSICSCTWFGQLKLKGRSLTCPNRNAIIALLELYLWGPNEGRFSIASGVAVNHPARKLGCLKSESFSGVLCLYRSKVYSCGGGIWHRTRRPLAAADGWEMSVIGKWWPIPTLQEDSGELVACAASLRPRLAQPSQNWGIECESSTQGFILPSLSILGPSYLLTRR
jgi:hypothetical protein